MVSRRIGDQTKDLGVRRTRFRDELVNRVMRYPGAVVMRLRVARLRLLGVRVGSRCWIRRVEVPRNPWDIAIGDGVALDDNVVLLVTGQRKESVRLEIGRGTYVNRFTMFDASESIVVGQNCLIGPFCYLTDHDHGTDPSGLFAGQPFLSGHVRIGDNVWIGAGAKILKGVTIGDGAVIGAGAVVTRDVASGEKAVGVPARPLSPQLDDNR